MPSERRLESKGDFQRFCAQLRTSSPSLDDLVEGLRDLAASDLRPVERGRVALVIARQLGESFHESVVRAVASERWPPEIAMALRQAPAQRKVASGSTPDVALERDEVELRELARSRATPLTVALLGAEDEHRASLDRLRAMGIRCLRERSLGALRDAFEREVVVGLVVGASWWAAEDPLLRSPHKRLEGILASSNLCWIKLVRAAAWASLETHVFELCMRLHFSYPPVTRLTVEDHATITDPELQCLAQAAYDLSFAERSFDYDVQPSPAQDRILRAASSRYLREKFPTIHARDSSFEVRTLASRGAEGLASLVSVEGTDVALVVKVSAYAQALDEARRFRWFAHGASFEMEFFCHGSQGALVFAPMDTRLGAARSLDDVLAQDEPAGAPDASSHRAAIDGAIAALRRFSQQLRPEGVSTFCNVEHEDTAALLARCGPLVVAGETIVPQRVFVRGLAVLDECSRQAVVHGDAHPGNILFSTTGAAILIDYECAGLGPACYDLCVLWIHVLASRFVALGDERATVALLRDLLAGVAIEAIEARWSSELRLRINREVVYLVHRAIEASVAVMAEHGRTRDDVHALAGLVLCRELLNPRLQQLAIRCALAATSGALGLRSQ